MKNFHRCLMSLIVLLAAGCGPAASATPGATGLPASAASPSSIPASPTIPAPTVVPTATLAPLGEIQDIPSGYIYLGDRQKAALGFNMSAGGAIGSLLYNGMELVDDADFGRYIQFSPYDGDDPYRCGPSSCFTDWGWNPLQAGSSDGIPAPVEEFRRWENGLYIKSPGQEWAASRPGSDVIYETWAWDRGGYFEVHTRMTHTGSDTHAAAGAEAPAGYFGRAIPLEYGYTGPSPFFGEPIQQYQMVTEDMSNNTNPKVFPTEHWMAFGNAQGVGLIMALPPQRALTDEWSMVFIRRAYPSPIGYLAPFTFSMTGPGTVMDLTYYLIPGPIEAGRALVYDLIPHTYWSFDLGGTEGWMDQNQAAHVSEGALLVDISETNPLSSRTGLNQYGVQAPIVWLETQAPADADVCLSFITLEDPVWDAGKASCERIGNPMTYRFDFSSNEKWMNGLVTQLRVTGSPPARLEIKAMSFMGRLYGWEFGNPPGADGWYALSQLDQLEARDGSLVSRSHGDDPYMISPFFDIPADHSQIEIRMRTRTPSGAKFFFITGEDPNWDEAKSLRFDLVADGEFHVYTVDLSAVPGWQGQIRQLRLDPLDAPGEIAVDYIRLSVP